MALVIGQTSHQPVNYDKICCVKTGNVGPNGFKYFTSSINLVKITVSAEIKNVTDRERMREERENAGISGENVNKVTNVSPFS